MNANVVFDAAPHFDPGKLEGRPLCVSCQDRTSLRVVVAELLYKNQLLRYKLSQSQALVGQLQRAFDKVQLYPDSAAEIRETLNMLSALLYPELEC